MNLSRQPDTDELDVLNRWSVSRETADRLRQYADLVRSWQRTTNLVAPSTLPLLWTRHMEDGLWLDAIAGPDRQWVDIGSGGGFPGLVLACLAAGRTRTHGAEIVHLVEANAKKAAFLRTVIRQLDLPATVHCKRIEQAGDILQRTNAISARALASLDMLIGLVAPHLGEQAVCYFLKGRAHQAEIAEASAHWRFDMVKHPSRADAESVILELRNCARLDA